MGDCSDVFRMVVWDKMAQAKGWEQYASQYCQHIIVTRKWLNGIIIALSTVGVASWIIIERWFDAYTWVIPVMFTLVLVTQILSGIQSELIMDTDKQNRLSHMRGLYIQLYTDLERIWMDIEKGDVDVMLVETRYDKLMKKQIEIESIKDSLNIKTKKCLHKKALLNAQDEIKKFYSFECDA